MKIQYSVVPAVLLAVLSFAQQPSPAGFDRSSLDPACKPCQDFWRYANGGWLDKHPIPSQYAAWGVSSVLRETTESHLHDILESAAADTAAKPGANRRKTGDLYSACMDTAAIDAQGIKPVQPYLDRIAAVSSRQELLPVLISLQHEFSTGPFSVGANGDLKDSSQVILYIGTGGLSLPERDYYFKDDARSKQIREEFRKHVASVFAFSGDTPDASEAAAAAIMSFETKLAEATKTAVERRDPNGMYHKMDLAGLNALTPGFPWKPVFAAYRIPETAPINVTEPEFLKRFDQQMATVPVADWKTWLRWRVLDRTSSELSKPYRDEDFHFRSAVLRGIKEQQPRWRTCTDEVDAQMGEALGEIYVEKYFPPQSKQRVKDLVENLRVTLREEIRNADWLTPETIKQANAKLDAYVAKIGYPDKWRDYSALPIDRKSYFADTMAASRFEQDFRLARIGKQVDRTEWHMTPPTLNAYYNPLQNEIVFPAGILQPPFFDPAGDDALNYGAIGAVIGHEMGHGFDDKGSQFDKNGNLKNWWTADDRKSFETRAGCVIEQFDALDAGGGLHHKGKLVVGEAMGDLNGLKLAYQAYHRSLNGKPAPVIDGFTGDQRFFLAFARAWGSQSRPEATQVQLNTNPHPLAKFRANATLQNMPEFHEAFHCQAGDAMVRPTDKQCKLW